MTDITTAPPDVPVVNDVGVDDEAGVREGIAVPENGTIRLWIDGRRYKLRRPRAREFRNLREAFHDASEDISRFAEEQDAWDRQLAARSAARDAAGETPITSEERRERRQRNRKMAEDIEAVMFGWWQHTWEVLGEDDKPFPDPDDLPIWLGTIAAANQALNHWRSVPSLSGGR